MMIDEELFNRSAKKGTLNRDDVEGLFSTHDILSLGVIADEKRKLTSENKVSYVRVMKHQFNKPLENKVLPSATEVRLTGTPTSVADAIAAVELVKPIVGERFLSGFSLADLSGLTQDGGLLETLRGLKEAGLDMVSELPLDNCARPETAIENLTESGFKQVRLTIQKAQKENRVELLMCARMLCEQYPIAFAINPLPTRFDGLRQTTGFDDTRFVALARIVTNISTIQVDWQQYGPKLAQVALMFGADDLDNVSGLNTSPNGLRRAPVAEVQQNVKAAGFIPEERNGYFKVP